jgi:hypothetical protein
VTEHDDTGQHGGQHPGPPGDPEVGSLAEEAAKLFDALSDYAREQGGQLGSTVGESAAGLAGHATRFAHDVEEHLATGDAECRYCPICRTVHAVRGLSPEVKAHLASAASSLAHAAAGVLATAVPQESEGGERRSDHVTRIDLDDDAGAAATGADEHPHPEHPEHPSGDEA